MAFRRFARKKLGSWLWPSLAGPLVGMWCALLLRAIFFGGSKLGLIAWLPLGTGIAGCLALTLLLTDLCLVLLRARVPPTGARAWFVALMAPVPLLFVWEFLRPPLLSTPMHHAGMLAVSLLLTTVPLRLLTSARPGSGFRFGG